MIIRSFSIDRFGIFAGQSVPGLAPGLNIFLGDNEAGKSTLLDFFRAMFFGYKRSGRNSLDYAAHAASAAVSGGSLSLANSRGEHFNLVRRPGKHGGELSLSDAAGRPLADSFLADLLGNYTDKMYDQVFCFGHGELASLAGMKEPQVSGVLHAAAFGTGFRAPLEVTRLLFEGQKKLYSKKASTTPIYKNFKRLEDIRADLARLGSELGRYNARKAERETLALEQAALKDEAAALSLGLARTHSLLAAWDDWLALGAERSALALNPHPGGEFSLESIERFDEFVASLDERRAERKQKAALLAQGRQELLRGAAFAALNDIYPECQSLLARRESVQKAMSGLDRLERLLGEACERQSALVKGLGTDWSLTRVLDFEVSLALQEGIDLGRLSLDSAAHALADATSEASRLASEAREAGEAAQALRHSLGQGAETDAGDAAITLALYTHEARARLEHCGRDLAQAAQAQEEAQKRQSLLEGEEAQARDELAEIDQSLDEACAAAALAGEEARAARRPPLFRLATAREDTRRVPWLLLCLVLALLCFSGTYKYFDVTALGQTSWEKFTNLEAWKLHLRYNWLIFGLGLAFLWGALYWLAPRAATLGRWQPKDDSADLLSPREREALGLVNALQGRRMAQEDFLARNTASLNAARAAAAEAGQKLSQAREAWAGQTALYALGRDCPGEAALRIFDSALQAALAAKKARAAAEAQEKAQAKLEGARASWRDWIKSQGFSQLLTPETVRHAIQRIEDIKGQSLLVADREAALASAREDISSFTAATDTLCRRAAFDKASGNILQRFDALYKAAFAAREETLRLNEQARELKKLEAELTRLDELLRSQEKRLDELLAQGQAADEADYRLRFKQQAAHMKIRASEERLLARLEQAASQSQAAAGLSGGEALWTDSQDFLRALGQSSREGLTSESARQQEALQAINDRLTALQERQGEIKAELDTLESGKGSTALQTEETALKEELKSLARDWGVRVMARKFIEEARRSFEEERHDSVVRQAGEIFSRLTGARYEQMRFDIAGKDFKASAVCGSGESLDSESALSQGTREQLYLALRLAFIRQHNLGKESLPLIMDDILVNFDPKRSRFAAKEFAAFSAVNQGLFFTCHPHIAKLFRDVAPDAKLFNIVSGKISFGE